jgi:hypothetical protein
MRGCSASFERVVSGEIDRTYSHLARYSESAIRARFDARSRRDGMKMAGERRDDAQRQTGSDFGPALDAPSGAASK